MPEAVIVSTARSPIGRAGKGSLVDMLWPRRWCARRWARYPRWIRVTSTT